MNLIFLSCVFLGSFFAFASGLKCHQKQCSMRPTTKKMKCEPPLYGECEKDASPDAEFCFKMDFKVNHLETFVAACASKEESDLLGRKPKCFNSSELENHPFTKDFKQSFEKEVDAATKIEVESICICNKDGCNSGTEVLRNGGGIFIPHFFFIFALTGLVKYAI